MTDNHQPAVVRRALLSVSDKSGLLEFARGLVEHGVELISTGGTHKKLAAEGLPVTEISDHTGFPEMMDGRVKTLHPKVHGGLLGLRDDAGHRDSMEEHGIAPIDLVVVNLYPFEATVAKPDVQRAEAIEQIDIGGPSMLRSAAKNHRFVGVVTSPVDYTRVLAELTEHGGALTDKFRRELALRAFEATARYDAAIAAWLFEQERRELEAAEPEAAWPETYTVVGERRAVLRYGENPHQTAALYATEAGPDTLVGANVLGGKALSYNNYLDLEAALALVREFDEPFVCVLKHTNPCGAAIGASAAEALEGAWAGDPLSAFGSILGFNREVDLACAEFLVAEKRFVEAIVAPSFSAEALERISSGAKWAKNVRLLEVAGSKVRPARRDVRPISGGFLVQDADGKVAGEESFELKTSAEPSPEQRRALVFANRIVKHVKSNAIVLTDERRVLGVGAGQMSRVDSVRCAIAKAGDRVQGSCLASDAFFPFPDGPIEAMRAGVTAFVQPGGSVQDKKVVAACEAGGAAMVFTGTRHFRH